MYVVTNQLELSGGMKRDRGECLVDAELYMPPSALQKKGTLYIITEIEGVLPEQVDPAGRSRSNDAALCAETQVTILQNYYNSNANSTITSALRHALEFANQQVFNRNSTMLPPERRGVGVTCAVVRGQELYLAQLPPTQAFLTHQGQLKALPTAPERVRGPRVVAPVSSGAGRDTLPMPTPATQRRTDTAPALGRYTSIEPMFSRHVFEDGDLLVLCSTNLAQQLSNEQADNLLLGQESRSALYNLADLARSAHITDAYVLTVGAKSEYGNIQPSVNLNGKPPAKPDEGRLRSSVEGVAASVSMLTSKFSARNNRGQVQPQRSEEYVYDDGSNRPVNAPKPFVPPIEPTPPIVMNQTKTPVNPVEPLLTDDRDNDPWLRREEDNLQHPPYLRNRKLPDEQATAPAPAPRNFTYNNNEVVEDEPSRTYVPLLPHINEENEPLKNENEAAWGAPPAKPARKGLFDRSNRPNGKRREAARLKATPASSPYVDLVGVDGYGPPVAEPRGIGRVVSSLRGKRWFIPVVLLILLGLAVWFLVSALNGGPGSGSSKALDYVKAAEQKRQQAQSLAATNPSQARKLIELARTDLAAATKEKADLADISSVQNGLKITLDNINRVVVPPDLRLAVDLTSQGTGVKVAQGVLAEAGDVLYLLDTGRGMVYAADLVGGIKPILKTGDPAGGSIFGKPVVMAARLDTIVVLDDQNISYIYNKGKGDWTATKLGGSAGWTKPVRQIATYQGNLYVLGPANNQILKYNAGAYAANPEEWVNPSVADNLKLEQAGALAIDGNIFTVSKEGHLIQLARPNGKPKGEIQADYELNVNDVVGPTIKNPSALQVGPLDYGYAFIVDAEKRVLQFQKEGGGFIQQFMAAPTGKEFDNLRDVAVDSINKKLYIIGEQKVYVFRLPETTAGPVINATVTGPVTPGTTLAPQTSPSPKPSPTFRP